jgi:hypothetical protein
MRRRRRPLQIRPCDRRAQSSSRPSFVGAMAAVRGRLGVRRAVRIGRCRPRVPTHDTTRTPSPRTTTEYPSLRAPRWGCPRCAGSSRARSPTSRLLPAYAAAHRVVLPQYPRSTAADGTAAVPKGCDSRPPLVLPPEYPPLRCCHCLPAPCQRPEHRTTHARSPTAPSTPMLRLVRRIARCR